LTVVVNHEHGKKDLRKYPKEVLRRQQHEQKRWSQFTVVEEFFSGMQ